MRVSVRMLVGMAILGVLLPIGGSGRCRAQQTPAPTAPAASVQVADVHTAEVHIDGSKVLRTFAPQLLLGTNIAVWNEGDNYTSPTIRRALSEIGPGIIRMPGGPYSDRLFWNGKGVRDAKGEVDVSRVRNGYPQIDYSGYAPSFVINAETRLPQPGSPGTVDVKAQHEFIRSLSGCETLVVVNAGTGRPQDAAEWVRWANKKQKYKVRYWEIGNEPEGAWEPGHYLPNGRPLTPELYVARFKEFAQAMKAVDPTIKIGGAASATDTGGYAQALLRDAGRFVDFVSFHTYPCQPDETEDSMIARAKHIQFVLDTVHYWIHKYQPQRAPLIQVGVTEWNMFTSHVRSDLFPALWSCVFIGEMARGGADFANQWDLFTQRPGEDTGFALVRNGRPPLRKAQYWAFWLCHRYLGPQLVFSQMQATDKTLYSVATRSADALYLMLVNSARDHEATVTVNLDGFDPTETGEEAILSQREFFWNPLIHQADWNSGPQIATVPVGKTFTVSLPAFSVKFVKIPRNLTPIPPLRPDHSLDSINFSLIFVDAFLEKERIFGASLAESVILPGLPLNMVPAPAPPVVARPTVAATPSIPPTPVTPPGKPELRIFLPSEEFVDTRIEGWVRVFRKGTNLPYPLPLPDAKIAVRGAGHADRPTVRLAEAAGRFYFRPTGVGPVTVSITLPSLSATVTLRAKSTIPQPFTYWKLQESMIGKEFASDWKISADATARPDHLVARVDLPSVISNLDHRSLLAVTGFPEPNQLKRENIRGVFFDLRFSHNFHCADRYARIEVILQSKSYYWMSLGTIPLTQATDGWHTETFSITNAAQIQAMADLYTIRLILHADSPVRGSVYIDNIGLLVL